MSIVGEHWKDVDSLIIILITLKKKGCKVYRRCHENGLKGPLLRSITQTVMFIRSLHFHFRDKLAFTQSRAASYFFDGSSYAVVRDITRRGKFGQVTRFDIEVRTPADNGLVLLMVNGVSKNKSSASLLPVLSAIHVSRNLPRLNVPCHQTEVLI